VSSYRQLHTILEFTFLKPASFPFIVAMNAITQCSFFSQTVFPEDINDMQYLFEK